MSERRIRRDIPVLNAVGENRLAVEAELRRVSPSRVTPGGLKFWVSIDLFHAYADPLEDAARDLVDYVGCLMPDECGGRIGTCRRCSLARMLGAES